MSEPTKEQIEKWTSEAEKHFPRPFWGGRDGDMDEWHGKVEGYLAAKKSDFEEIKTLKEQLAEAVEVIRKCRNHNYLGGEAFLDRITEHFLEKQDKENKE